MVASILDGKGREVLQLMLSGRQVIQEYRECFRRVVGQQLEVINFPQRSNDQVVFFYAGLIRQFIGKLLPFVHTDERLGLEKLGIVSAWHGIDSSFKVLMPDAADAVFKHGRTSSAPVEADDCANLLLLREMVRGLKDCTRPVCTAERLDQSFRYLLRLLPSQQDLSSRVAAICNEHFSSLQSSKSYVVLERNIANERVDISLPCTP